MIITIVTVIAIVTVITSAIAVIVIEARIRKETIEYANCICNLDAAHAETIKECAMENIEMLVNSIGENRTEEERKIAKELMDSIDEALNKSIIKLRNATTGIEVRTFITEYEELMLKKSDEITKSFLKHHK